MFKRAKLIVLLVATAALAAAGDKPLQAGRKIFIDHMPQDLDGYIKAEFVKQKVHLTVVSKPEEADYVLTGSATEEERRKWHEGWLTTERDKTSGSAEIIDAKTKVLVWAGEAGDRSLWWSSMRRGGQRKVADRLVDNLKKYIRD